MFFYLNMYTQLLLVDFSYTYELVESIANWLLERVPIRPTTGIICGSGMGKFTKFN